MIWLQILAYISIVVFVLITFLKFIRYLTMPMHLRWELYPVPHEKGKDKYGGSYYEEPEWWKKPIETTIVGELKETLIEMLFIKRLFKYNRSLWYLSSLFHWGIYLILIWFLLIFISAISSVLDLSTLESVTLSVANILGPIGMILLTIGCLGLLLRRIADKDLRKYSSILDYINLLFILTVVVTGLIAWRVDTDFSIAKSFAKSLITFTPLPEIPSIIVLHVVLLSALVIYIPFTKISHYIAKYFTYHYVLWDDHPNLANAPIRRKVKEVLGYKLTWSAPHIRENLTWEEEAKTIEPVLKLKTMSK